METIVAVVVWLIFGLIVGGIARLLMPGRQGYGLGFTVVSGIVGSLIGGFLSWVFFGGPREPFHPGGWITSILGAVLFVWLTSSFASRGSRSM